MKWFGWIVVLSAGLIGTAKGNDHTANEGLSSGIPTQLPMNTPLARFTSTVAAAGSLTLVTEMGDKTFFVAAMMATKYAKLPVFLGSVSALWIQTLICSVLGVLVHHLPSRHSGWLSWPLDDYVAAVLLFGFGIVHLKDGIWTPETQGNETTPDLEDLPTYVSGKHHESKNLDQLNSLHESLLPSIPTSASQVVTPTAISLRELASVPPIRVPRRLSTSSARVIAEAHAEIQRSSTLRSSSEVYWKAFGVVTAAEFGDRSMFSTIALAASQNPYGVFLGASLGHAMVTTLAVTCAMVLHRFVSERATNLVGGGLFLVFGVLSFVEGLVRQGVLGDDLLSL